MEIRKANIDDIYSLNVLFTKLYNYECRYNENYLPDLRFATQFDENKINNDIIFVLDNGDKIVGYIHGYIKEFATNKEKEYYISTIYINSDIRRMGYGSKLINKFIDEVKELGGSYISINNYLENKEARELYNKLGFNILKEDRRRKI